MPPLSERIRLTGTPIGRKVRIADFGDEIDPLQREQLHAYGMSAPQAVTVLQQQPMTVVLCDHMELALEHDVARHVWVEEGSTRFSRAADPGGRAIHLDPDWPN